jgi:glutamate dehydrogenase
LSIAGAQAADMIDVHARLIHHLEQVAHLNREIEFLPSEETIGERKVARQGLVAAELAVVMAYSKIHLYAELLDSDLPEDPYLAHDLERYFPSPLPERFASHMRGHRLRREIIATVVANQMVDRAGTSFAFRVGEETGAPASALARAFAVAREVFDMRSFVSEVEALDNLVDAQVQLSMLIESRRLVERASRWLVRANPRTIDIEATVAHFASGAAMLAQSLPGVLGSVERETFESRAAELASAGVPAELVSRVAGMPALFSALDIVEVAGATGRPLETVTATYFRVGSSLELTWLRDRIIELPRANRWQALARAALRDDLYSLLRALSQEVLQGSSADGAGEDEIAAWVERNSTAVERVRAMLADIKASRVYDMTTLPVALREVRNLIQTGASAEAASIPEAAPTPEAAATSR